MKEHGLLFSMVCSVCFLIYQAGPQDQGWPHPPSVGRTLKKMPHTHIHRSVWWERFLSLRSFFPDDPRFSQFKKQRTKQNRTTQHASPNYNPEGLPRLRSTSASSNQAPPPKDCAPSQNSTTRQEVRCSNIRACRGHFPFEP